MNDFVLRGFCQHDKCGYSITLKILENGKDHAWLHDFLPNFVGTHDIIPCPTLSPKQMRICATSKEMREWANERYSLKLERGEEPYLMKYISVFLEEEPFLVVKILLNGKEESEGE